MARAVLEMITRTCLIQPYSWPMIYVGSLAHGPQKNMRMKIEGMRMKKDGV